MTAALSLDQRRLNRAEQVEHLRRKMAAVSGKVGGGRRGRSAVDRPASGLGIFAAAARIAGRTASRRRCRAGRWRCCRAPGRCR